MDDTLLIIIILKAEIKSNHLSKAHALYVNQARTNSHTVFIILSLWFIPSSVIHLPLVFVYVVNQFMGPNTIY